MELLGPEVLFPGELRGWGGAGEDMQGSWRGKGQALGSRGRAERNWAMGSDLKNGAGKLAGCLVLKRVSENLSLLILSDFNCSCQPCAILAASGSAPSSLQGLSLSRSRAKQEQSCKRGQGGRDFRGLG